METKIKQRLGNMSTKKRGGERYEKVQRRGREEDEGGEDSGSSCAGGGDNDNGNTKGNSRCAVIGSTLRTVKEKVQTDMARSYHEARHFPTDMYYVFVLKFLESYSYFALSQILVLYLHEDFGVSDVEAGVVYGM
jgi:hypothetical protein